MARRTQALMVLAVCSALAATGSAGAAEQAKESAQPKATAQPKPPAQAKDTAQAKRIEVVRGRGAFLGVSLEEVTHEDVARLKLAAERGARVVSVEAGSPAEKAGLKADDVILRFQGEDVRSARQLARLVREEPPGRSVSMDVSRAGSALKLQAQLEGQRVARREWRFAMPDLDALLDRDFTFELPDPPEPPEPPLAPELPLAPEAPRAPEAPLAPRLFRWEQGPRRLGIEYQEIGDQLARFFKLADDHGVLVARVDSDGPAAKAGVKAGDVILKVDTTPIRDGDDLRAALRKAGPGVEVTLGVQREGKPLDLKVKLGGSAEPRRPGMTT